MNFVPVISTFYQLPARCSVAKIAMVFAGLVWITSQCVAASGQKESVSQSAAKPASNRITPGAPQKTESVDIIARFFEITDPAFAKITAPGGALEKFAPSKSSANAVCILPPEQSETVFRALHRTKGVDLAGSPGGIVKSGHRNKIDLAMEFKYPTEWIFDKKLQKHTPTAFEVKEVGITLEVEATVKPGGDEIDLHAIPQCVEFLGFQSAESQKTGKALTDKPDPHHPYATVFRTRKVDTHIEFFSGQTLLIWLGNPLSEKEKQPGQRIMAVLLTAKSL